MALRALLLLCGISGLLTGAFSVTVTVPECPAGWVRLENRCFIYQDNALNFTTAEGMCNNAGGTLATISNSVENALAFQLVRDANSGSVVDTWIGIHDGITEGKFVRTDGSKSKFFDFRAAQPDNFADNEDCVEIDNEGQWNDETCTDRQDFLCSINLW